MRRGGREAALDPAQELLGADVAGGVGGEHREEAGADDGAVEHLVHLGDGDLLALEVPLHELLILDLGDEGLEEGCPLLGDQLGLLVSGVA